MADLIVLLDTSILIDYFRKENKEKTYLYIVSKDYDLAISTITEFEFLNGVNDKNIDTVNSLLKEFLILDFNSECAKISSKIYKNLKKINKLIPPPDIFIAATAINNNMELVTLNENHFQHISGLKLLKRTN
jgi:predicted nucleic acid-binding protein